MNAICLIGDREYASWEVPPDAKTSEVIIISVANTEAKHVVVMRFIKFSEKDGDQYYDLDSAFRLSEEHLESVKRISFE
jgi:hypothetical protein